MIGDAPFNAAEQCVLAAAGEKETLRWVQQAFREGKQDGVFAGRSRDLQWQSALVIRRGAEREPAAFATFWTPENRPVIWCHLLWVATEYRRMGLATRLLDELHAESWRRHLPVELSVFPGNGAMLTLLAKRGATLVGQTFKLGK